jgi:hypothetical protein
MYVDNRETDPPLVDCSDEVTGLRYVIFGPGRGAKDQYFRAYVGVPQDYDLGDIEPPWGWTGAWRGMPGWDTAHPRGVPTTLEGVIEVQRRLCAQLAAHNAWAFMPNANGPGGSLAYRVGADRSLRGGVSAQPKRGGVKVEAYLRDAGGKIKYVKPAAQSIRAACVALEAMGSPPVPARLIAALERAQEAREAWSGDG